LKIEKDYSSVLNNTDTANSLMGGIGVEYRLSRSLGMRLEYEYFVNGVYVSPYGTTHDSTIGLVSVGLKFRF
jgi:opacity protein-like surface antigen